MKVVFTSSRSFSIVSPIGGSGGNAAPTGSIMRPMVSAGYFALRCHWRTSSALAAALARSRASAGSAPSTSCANPGERRESGAAISAPPKCSSFAAAPAAERLLMSCASSAPNAAVPDWSIADMLPPLLLLAVQVYRGSWHNASHDPARHHHPPCRGARRPGDRADVARLHRDGARLEV